MFPAPPLPCHDVTGMGCVDADSIAYKFGIERRGGAAAAAAAAAGAGGAGGGIISFSFRAAERPDTRRDVVALGLSTTSSDAVLLSVSSSSSNDFLRLELVLRYFRIPQYTGRCAAQWSSG